MKYDVTITKNDNNAVYGPHSFGTVEDRQAYVDKIVKKFSPTNDESHFTIDLNRSEQSLYDEMVKDIYDEMEIVFGTRNDVSASAFAATYEAMIKRPASYIDAELGFNDEDAVLAYANSKLEASDAYGLYRLKRIGQYQAAKQAIENA